MVYVQLLKLWKLGKFHAQIWQIAYNYAHLKLLLLHSSGRRMSIARKRRLPTIKCRITIIPDLRTIYNLLRIINKPGAQVFTVRPPRIAQSKPIPRHTSTENNDQNGWSVNSLCRPPQRPQPWSNIVILLSPALTERRQPFRAGGKTVVRS